MGPHLTRDVKSQQAGLSLRDRYRRGGSWWNATFYTGSGSTSMAAASKPPRGTEGRAAATSDKDAKSPWLGPCGVEGHSHSDSTWRREATGLHCVRLPCLRTNWRLRDMLRSRECSTGCRFARSAPRPWGGRARPSGVFLLRCLRGGLVRVSSGRGRPSSPRSLCLLGTRKPGL